MLQIYGGFFSGINLKFYFEHARLQGDNIII